MFFCVCVMIMWLFLLPKLVSHAAFYKWSLSPFSHLPTHGPVVSTGAVARAHLTWNACPGIDFSLQILRKLVVSILDYFFLFACNLLSKTHANIIETSIFLSHFFYPFAFPSIKQEPLWTYFQTTRTTLVLNGSTVSCFQVPAFCASRFLPLVQM